MTMNTRISIITVSYNSSKSIRRTIESVLDQSVPPYEHIFVDGLSRDDTVSIIRSYQDQYDSRGIKLRLISEPDDGYYDAMNKGIHMATGDMIGILNSDDWYEKKALEIVNHYVKENPKADIYMGAIYIHNGNSIIRKNAGYRRYYQTSRDFNHPAMFARSKAYQAVGDYINGNVHNDYGWYLKALKMGLDVFIVPEVITNFMIGGVSSKKSFRNTLKRIRLKYQVYRQNGYSRLYMIECTLQELVKFVLIRS